MGQKCMSTRWVITKKFKDNNKIMKARLVAHGYKDLHNLKTDSPTCSHEAMHLVMLTVSIMKWQVETISLQHFCRVICLKKRYFLDHHLMYVQNHRYGS